jgi:hypothetical protein
MGSKGVNLIEIENIMVVTRGHRVQGEETGKGKKGERFAMFTTFKLK